MDTTFKSKVGEIITQAQQATMLEPVVRTSGAGKAYQSVAQSAAIAIQDATDALRNITTIATTAAGVAAAQALAGNPNDAALTQIGKIMDAAIKDYSAIGKAAAEILGEFPAN